jgi:uncharacterized membrane protein YeiB
METSEKPTQKRTLTTADPHDRTRDRSVDVLRGLTCFAMILVNTAAPIHPGWLAHPGDMRDPITFADVESDDIAIHTYLHTSIDKRACT